MVHFNFIHLNAFKSPKFDLRVLLPPPPLPFSTEMTIIVVCVCVVLFLCNDDDEKSVKCSFIYTQTHTYTLTHTHTQNITITDKVEKLRPLELSGFHYYYHFCRIWTLKVESWTDR